MNAYKLDVYSKLISICANVLVLGAVTLSMYMASFSPETHLAAFCTWFFSFLVPILAAAWFAKRTLRQRYDDGSGDDAAYDDTSYDDDPHARPSYAKSRGCTASNGLTGVRLMEKSVS